MKYKTVIATVASLFVKHKDSPGNIGGRDLTQVYPPILLFTLSQSKTPADKMTVTEVVLDKVVVHPLVLLSVVDHFSRQA